jgi:hypothetical protein
MVHDVEVDDAVGADVGHVVDRIVHPVSVHQQQHAGVEILRACEAAGADVFVAAVVMDVEAAQAAQHLAEGAPAVLADVVLGDDLTVDGVSEDFCSNREALTTGMSRTDRGTFRSVPGRPVRQGATRQGEKQQA